MNKQVTINNVLKHMKIQYNDKQKESLGRFVKRNWDRIHKKNLEKIYQREVTGDGVKKMKVIAYPFDFLPEIVRSIVMHSNSHELGSYLHGDNKLPRVYPMRIKDVEGLIIQKEMMGWGKKAIRRMLVENALELMMGKFYPNIQYKKYEFKYHEKKKRATSKPL